MIKKIGLLLWILSVTSFFTIQANPAEGAAAPQVNASLVLEETTIQPGHPFWAIVRLQLSDEWHTYWKNPGDAGMATAIEWTLPEGMTASSILWPIPERFVMEGTVGYGYKGEVLLLSQITPSSSLSLEKPIKLEANVSWLVCSDSLCMPGESSISSTPLKVSTTSPQLNEQSATTFKEARSRLPVKHEGIEAQRKKNAIEVSLQLPESNSLKWEKALFFPEEQNVIDHSAEVVISTTETHSVMTIKLLPQATNISSLKGVLQLKDGSDKTHSMEIDAPLAASDTLIGMTEASPKDSASSTEHDFAGGLGVALLLAFLGGLILNLMPCVLPVVSFKILSFVQMAGQSRALTFKHGLAFFWGVLVSFWVLAGFLLIFQAYGHSVGWGFQLQEPLFVAFLAALLLVFGLSLFGVFELGAFATNLAGKVSPKKEGLSGSFLSGVLATAVATPCTGPFLGSAIGFAFTVSAPEALLIFTFLGLGMALPYLILARYPHLLRFLPKPGSWMGTLKEIMGFVMIATVLWLIWVFSAQTGDLAVMLLLFGFFFIAIACWIFGKWGSAVHSVKSRTFSFITAFLCLALGSYTIIASTSSWVEQLEGVELADHSQEGSWEEFSPERLAELRAQGTPVLIDFTAKWCLICQVNHLVLNSEPVNQKVKELGVVRMKADWTKNDPVITQELKKYGRSGVPLYVLYGTDSAKSAEILPQMLTQKIVLKHLNSIETDDNGIISAAN